MRASSAGAATRMVSTAAAISVQTTPMVTLPTTASIGPTAMPASSSDCRRPMRSPCRSGKWRTISPIAAGVNAPYARPGADAAGDEPADRIAERVHQGGQRHHDDRAVDHQPLAAAVGVRGDGDLGDQRGDEAGGGDPAELCGRDVGALLQGREQREHHHERTRDGECAGVERPC